MTGYIIKTYDFHGAVKNLVRSNVRVYAVLDEDLIWGAARIEIEKASSKDRG